MACENVNPRLLIRVLLDATLGTCKLLLIRICTRTTHLRIPLSFPLNPHAHPHYSLCDRLLVLPSAMDGFQRTGKNIAVNKQEVIRALDTRIINLPPQTCVVQTWCWTRKCVSLAIPAVGICMTWNICLYTT